MDDLLADFLTETHESLAEIDTALVALERNPRHGATLQQIFRLVHTIKGTCGFLGLGRMEKVSHAAETVLGRFRDGALDVTPEAITLVLKAIDTVKVIVAGLEQNQAEPAGDDGALIAALEALEPGGATPEAAPAGTEAAPAAEAEADAPATAPPVASPAPAAAAPAPSAAPAAGAPTAARSSPPAAAAEAEAASAEGNGSASVASQTIRVHVDVAEDLMTLVSELVLTRNQLLQMARTQEGSAFTVPLQRLSHITSDLQEGVMKLRMQPIGNAWNKLPRLVRDLARETGKRIELVMRGADTELDRQVLEVIKDPLTHMVRNAADHGLEPTEARRAAGKPEVGRVTLNAYHEGGYIIIEIADDGRGLSTERIRAKALAQGLASEAELAAMTEADIQQFIFRPGFSTATAVTSVSGRGVGMDVVKTNVSRIGGSIELRSVADQGTTVTIKIPLTLAIVSALIVASAGERFAIPQIGVVELVRVGGSATSRVERINGAAVLRLRDRLLPLVDLADLLRLAPAVPAEGAAEKEASPERFVVVTQVGASTFGIIVDRVFDTEEIVVKPVAPILRHITLFSGNTILGDGSVIMILDPNGIARAVGAAKNGPAAATQERDAAATAAASEDSTALLIFRAGGVEPKAVPLGLVARLEAIPRERIERVEGRLVTQYRGQLMQLLAIEEGGFGVTDPTVEGASPRQSVLVFSDRDKVMGLMVDQILDVVAEKLALELAASRPGFLGSAVIAGRATDVIDVGYHLSRAFSDWFGNGQQGSRVDGRKPRLLLVEDSGFFRALMVPILGAAGYEVTLAENAPRASRLREGGFRPDAIISDIEMPEMDGFAFVEEVRSGGPWAELPVIALTSHASPEDIARGRAAGFTDYVVKLDREAVLAAIAAALRLVAEGGLAAGAPDTRQQEMVA